MCAENVQVTKVIHFVLFSPRLDLPIFRRHGGAAVVVSRPVVIPFARLAPFASRVADQLCSQTGADSFERGCPDFRRCCRRRRRQLFPQSNTKSGDGKSAGNPSTALEGWLLAGTAFQCVDGGLKRSNHLRGRVLGHSFNHSWPAARSTCPPRAPQEPDPLTGPTSSASADSFSRSARDGGMCLALSTRPRPRQIGWSGSGPHSRRRIAATPRRGPVRRVT
jgi:hypothetical protein